MISELAAGDPTGLAVDDGTRRRSWAELQDRAIRIARFLRDEAGVQPDEHVAVLMENRVEYVELILGAIMAGVWITPINWHLSRDEIAYVLRDSGSRFVFSDERHAAVARDAGANRPAVPQPHLRQL